MFIRLGLSSMVSSYIFSQVYYNIVVSQSYKYLIIMIHVDWVFLLSEL